MKIEFREEFDIPNSTPQQRKLGGKNTHPTAGLRYARAAWQALLERHRPPKPMDKSVMLHVTLNYHTADTRRDGQPKTTRPDGDNILKIIKDAATRAGWWRDDAIVFLEFILRRWTLSEESVEIFAEGE
ncbi:MAG: RusA family crossover junction endodeoxyribonuclease [Victivallales bacterium]|nr:RusA family crossover junction endodeoxyribonuclease [Victivallales bacterium]